MTGNISIAIHERKRKTAERSTAIPPIPRRRLVNLIVRFSFPFFLFFPLSTEGKNDGKLRDRIWRRRRRRRKRDICSGYRHYPVSYRIRDSFEQQKIRSGRKITIPVSSFGILSLSLSLSSSKVHGISVGCLTGRTGRVGSGILIRFRNPFRKGRGERVKGWPSNFSRKSIESRRSLANVPVKKITLACLSLPFPLPLLLTRSPSSPNVFAFVQGGDRTERTPDSKHCSRIVKEATPPSASISASFIFNANLATGERVLS